MAHTPGPWNTAKVFINNNADGIQVFAGKRSDGTHKCVADCGTSAEETTANAHLIAAAPKMLDTLKELQSYLRGFLDPEISVDVGMDTDILNQIAMIDKLIAEAEGKL